MIPYIWNKIDWNFVLKYYRNNYWFSNWSLFIKVFISETTHLSVCFIIIFFIFINEGILNTKINNNYDKFFTRNSFWNIKWINHIRRNACCTFFISYKYSACIIRGSLAALFFLTDIYAFILKFFCWNCRYDNYL